MYLFFLSPYARVTSRTLGYDIKFPQVFAVFSTQSSSTSDNEDDLNNEPSTSEMSRVETPQTYQHKNWNLNGRFAKTSDDSTNSKGTNFDKHFQINNNKS
jgi:hypothetical protein